MNAILDWLGSLLSIFDWGYVAYYSLWALGILVVASAVAWFLWKLGTIRGT